MCSDGDEGFFLECHEDTQENICDVKSNSRDQPDQRWRG